MNDTKSTPVLKESPQASVNLHVRSRVCATTPALLIYSTLVSGVPKAWMNHFIMVTLRRFDKGKVFKNV